jgi:hypothetical protein
MDVFVAAVWLDAIGRHAQVHGGRPMSVAETLGYRSPTSKLIRFFRSSRDKWKSKCQAAKQENNSLKIRLAKMTESRDRWKSKAKSAAADAETAIASPHAGTKNCGR